MRSRKPGPTTSAPEVVAITGHGFRLVVAGREYSLPFEKFPWFRDATEEQLRDVRLLHGRHLYWPSLDVDLSLAILEAPDSYRLVWS